MLCYIRMYYDSLAAAALRSARRRGAQTEARMLRTRHTGVCEQDTPFTGASAMQSCSRNSSPAPDLVL